MSLTRQIHTSRVRRFSLSFLGPRLLAVGVFGAAGYWVGSRLQERFTRGQLRTDEEQAEYERVEQQLQSLPLVTAMRSSPNYQELRGPVDYSRHGLTRNTLAGPGRITVPPLAFFDPTTSQVVAIAHVGDGVCRDGSLSKQIEPSSGRADHARTIHPGLVATLMDEGLAMSSFLVFPNRIGVTASLDLSFPESAQANRFYLLKTKATWQKGRKAQIHGEAFELDDRGEQAACVAIADALFVEPRYAKYLKHLVRWKS